MKKLICLLVLVVSLSAQYESNKRDNLPFHSKSINTENYIKVSLIDVVLETVAQSNNTKSAREKLRQAYLKMQDAHAGYKPTLGFTYKRSGTSTTPLSEDDNSTKKYNDENYKLTVKQNIYSGGSTASSIKNLEKKYEIEKNNYKIVISKEIENAVKAYFDVLFNFQSFNVNTENMKRLQEILEIVSIKFESGATSIGNLSNIKASVSNAESQLIKVQSKFNESLEYYEYIVGDDFKETFPFEDKFDTNVDDFEKIVEKAILNNMALENYRLSIKAEKINLVTATAGFKPAIDLELTAEKVTDQEDYVFDETNYKAQVQFSYNFYNQGKDKNKILSINSKIREFKYKEQEEIRKLRWSLSKLHRSIISITNASKSKKEEVLASENMITAYWDGFKLGEQDLQELLQGQRQLNTAQLELITNKKTTVTDYFSLLSSTGELLNFFRLDIDSDNYIDFTKSNYRNLLQKELDNSSIIENNLLNIDDNEITEIDENITELPDNNKTLLVDLNTTDNNITVEDKNETVKKEDSVNDLLSFETKFLNASDDNWTITFYHYDKMYQALDFAQKNEILKDSFLYSTLFNDKIQNNIAYNIFDSKEAAQDRLNDLNVSRLNKRVVRIKDVKFEHYNFKNKNLQQKVKKTKQFVTSPEFKEKFLNADKDSYTINITSFSQMKEAQQLLKEEKIYNNSFVFIYGEQEEWVKVVYGVFDTYESAKERLLTLDNINEKYNPVIEIITDKQNLYNQYREQSIEKPSVQEFKSKFLSAPKKYYTLNLATLYGLNSVEKFYEKHLDLIDLFIFSFGEKNSEKYKAMGGVYKTYEEAEIALDNLPYILKKNRPRIEYIYIKQNLYKKYNENVDNSDLLKKINDDYLAKKEKDVALSKVEESNNTTNNVDDNLSIKKDVSENNVSDSTDVLETNTTIKNNIEEVVIVKRNENFGSNEFTEEFLNAPEDYFTLNLATVFGEDGREIFYKKNNTSINIFIFPFGGEDSQKYKAMGGVFSTLEEAQEAMVNLPFNLSKNKPRIERIKIKQKLYYKYNKRVEN